MAIGERLYSFPGGLKLRHHKQVSCQLPLTEAGLPEKLYIPIGQHQGDAGAVLVKPGDRVRLGQALTRALDDFQVPAHASASGTIEGLLEWPAAFPPGSRRRCLCLVPDDRDDAVPPNPLKNWQELSPDQLIDHLHQMGLAGLGGAMFPTAVKLRGDWPGIHTLILNGAECEPWISCDEMLMRHQPESVIEGALVLARAAGAEHIVIAIEDQMGAVEQALNRARDETDGAGQLRVVKVSTIYPEGGERQLIQVLTGQEVPHDGLPQDIGLLCQNVATAAAARAAVIDGVPLTQRIVTITGSGINQPRNLIARIGTPIVHLVNLAGGYTADVQRLVLGGPMSGTPLSSDAIPVTKGSNCVLALSGEELTPRQPTMPCINCGECVRVCPASLLPQLLYKAVAAQQHDQARDLNLFDCIECGCCAQVCPSHIPLVDWYRHGKDLLHLKELDLRKAALAKRRHEARQTRLEQAQAEREARRERRREKLETPDQAQSEIQAAIERARRKKQGDKR